MGIVERLQLGAGGLGRVRRRAEEADRRPRQLGTHQAIAAREAELEGALHEQLLVDQPVEDAAAVVLAGRIASVGGERGERARVIVGAHELAVHGRDGALGEARVRRPCPHQRGGRDGEAGDRAEREELPGAPLGRHHDAGSR